MKFLLFSSLLLVFWSFCGSQTIGPKDQPDWPVPDWPQYLNSRGNRRPPPPWDIPRPRPRSTARPTSARPTPTPKTSSKPIVLYKLACDPCTPGWGVRTMCTNKTATVCTPCPVGYWSPRTHHYRPCMPCSKCGDGLYEEETCTRTRDTKCDSCFGASIRVNDDFMKKCTSDEDAGVDLEDSIEIVDLKSKELNTNEDDLYSMTMVASAKDNPEEDITVDDPEIDTELTEKDDDDLDEISREQEEEWETVMAKRNRANDEIKWISNRVPDCPTVVDATSLDDRPTEEQVTVTVPIRPVTVPRRLFRPIRPLPQMMPVPERTLHVEPETDIVEPEEPEVENNYPPSYNGYPIDSLLHAGENQKRKAIVLLVLVGIILLATCAFVVCYVREYCRRRRMLYNRVLVVDLSPEEREIVRQSANALQSLEKPGKKQNGYSQLINANSETSIAITENPLESYLNCTDELVVQNESLVENEVMHEPRLHRSQDA